MTAGRVPEVRGSSTLKDVARLAGVSAALVSRYLNGSAQARMSETTRARIDAAIASLGYRPSPSARALRSGRSGIVGLAVRDLGNAYQAQVAELAVRELTACGYRVLLALCDVGDGDAAQAAEVLFGSDAEAVLLGTEGVLLRGPDGGCELQRHRLELSSAMGEALAPYAGCRARGLLSNGDWCEAFASSSSRLCVSSTWEPLSRLVDERVAQVRRLVSAPCPEVVVVDGWQTLETLLDLLDEGGVGGSPAILCHANIRGPFLSDARLAGAFCSSTTELVRGVCRRLVAALRQPSAVVRDCAVSVPVSFCVRGSSAYEALRSRHYRLT